MNVYHIGNPEEVTITELARKVAAGLGRDIEINTADSFAGETSRRCPDITKLHKLGYSPRITLEKGLAGTLDWYRSHMHLRNDRLQVA
jgi:UDP-glucose 4-epimerase